MTEQPLPDATPSPAQKEQPADAPKRRPGAKIEESPYRDQVATMLLTEQSYAYIGRFLEKVGLPVRFETIKEFETNYLKELSKEVKDKLLSAALEAQKKRNDEIVSKATYANLSRVEVLILLIGEAEFQYEQLKGDSSNSYMQRQDAGAWLDRINRLRKELEEARLSSEVQMERTRAIEAVTAVALKYLKDNPQVEAFLKTVDGIHKNPLKS